MELPRCRVLALAETVIDRWWCRRACDPFWRLYCNRDAGAELIAGDGARIDLLPDHFYLVPAWVAFKGRATGPIRHRFAHFQVAGPPPAWLRRSATRPLAVTGGSWPDPASVHPAQLLAVQALLCGAVAEALAGAPPPDADTRTATLIAPAMDLIEARLHRPPPVAELAAACGVGADHFARCFTACVGQSPARWIRERRIAAAAERLTAGDASVAAVAQSLGFANPFHFSRVFRRITGHPPAAWRNGLEVAPTPDGR